MSIWQAWFSMEEKGGGWRWSGEEESRWLWLNHLRSLGSMVHNATMGCWAIIKQFNQSRAEANSNTAGAWGGVGWVKGLEFSKGLGVGWG